MSRRRFIEIGGKLVAVGAVSSVGLGPKIGLAADTVKVGILHSLTGTIAIAEAAIVDADENTDTIYGDDIGIEDIIWMGNLPKLKDRALEAGVRRTAPRAAFDETVRKAMDPRYIIESRNILGGPGRKQVTRMLTRQGAAISKHSAWLGGQEAKIEGARRLVSSTLNRLTRGNR